MNSLPSRMLLIGILLISLRPAATPQNTPFVSRMPENYQQLTRKGASILGVKQDSSHFITCKGKQLAILAGDTVVDTDKTCEDATGDPRCTLCVMHRESQEQYAHGSASATQSVTQDKAQNSQAAEPQATPGPLLERGTQKTKSSKSKSQPTPSPTSKRDAVPPQ